MALVLQDRVSVNSTGSGTGNLALSSAYPGFRTFASCVPDGSIVYYTITNQAAGYADEWEVGYGKYVLGTNTLVRNNGNAAETGVYSSSNANAYVNFTAGTNGLQVFITYPAEQAVFQQPDGITEFSEGPISVVGANSTPASFSATLAQFFSNVPSFSQLYVQNQSADANASSDIVAYNNLGDGSSYFVDMGINSSAYNSADYPIFPENSAYVFSGGDIAGTGAAGETSDLYLGTSTANSNVVIFGGSVNAGAEIATFVASTKNVNFANGISATGNVSANNVVLTGAAYANAAISSANQLVTKEYVDNATSTGIHIHTPVAAETSAALSAVYTQGGTTFNITDITGTNTVVTSTTHGLAINDQIWLTTTAGNGLSINTPYFVYSTPTTTSLQLSLNYGGVLLTGLTNASGLSYATRANSGVGAYLEASANEALPIAGVTTSDRVLVYNQSTGYWNGVYTVTSLGSGASKWKLTRATDANKYEPDNTAGMGAGDYFFIQSNSEAYVLTDPTGPFIIGYDPITYTLFSSVPIYTGTAPINVSGSTIALTGIVDTAYGGTNLSSYTTGDIIYSNASNSLAKLAIGSQYNVLSVSGAGVPHWSTVNLANANAVTGSLPATFGGTGQTTYTLGDIIYSDASNSLAKLPGQTTVTKKYLSQTGDGVNSAAPAWSQVAAADISGLAPSATTDTSNASNITSGTLPTGRISGSYTGLTGTGTLTVGTWNANVITSSYGGTGVAGTITGIPYANGASAYTAASAAQVVSLIGTTAVANATYAVSSNSSTYTSNILGGAAGSIPYQNGANSTSLLATGSGVLVGGVTPAWSTAPTLTGTNFSSIPNSATTATAANTASAIVARDASGNFTAGTITATLNGSATSAGSATTAVTVTQAAQANITSVGTLTSLTSSGTITASSFSGAGTGLTGTASSLTAGAATLAANTSSISSAVGNTYTWTGYQYFQSNQNTGTGSSAPLQAYSSSGGAIMAFHRAGVYAVNMGLDSDNVFRIGGWSAAANLLQMDMSGNLTMAGNVTAYSDEKLKKNWRPVQDNFVSKLAKVKSGIYDRVDQEATQAGVSAQSLQTVLPETVVSDAEGTLSVNYGAAAMVSCVELAKVIEELRAEIAELKAK